jgi:hypothetical protein
VLGNLSPEEVSEFILGSTGADARRAGLVDRRADRRNALLLARCGATCSRAAVEVSHTVR